MIKKVNELTNFALSERVGNRSKSTIKKAKTETKKKIYEANKSILKYALKLHDGRTIMINAFAVRDIFPEDVEDAYLEEQSKYEESTAERAKMRRQKQQQAKGLKILTPQQMLSRLPISLAELKAVNNSEKVKNEIRQLLYSLIDQKS